MYYVLCTIGMEMRYMGWTTDMTAFEEISPLKHFTQRLPAEISNSRSTKEHTTSALHGPRFLGIAISNQCQVDKFTISEGFSPGVSDQPSSALSTFFLSKAARIGGTRFNRYAIIFNSYSCCCPFSNFHAPITPINSRKPLHSTQKTKVLATMHKLDNRIKVHRKHTRHLHRHHLPPPTKPPE